MVREREFLGVDELVALHRQASSVGEFDNAFIDNGKLDFIVAKIVNTNGINKKAMELVKGIVQGHPFGDGNKRTAALALVVFLEMNGKHLIVSDKTIERFLLNIAQEKITNKQVTEWIANNSR